MFLLPDRSLLPEADLLCSSKHPLTTFCWTEWQPVRFRSTTGHNRLLEKREDTSGLLGLVEDNTGAFSGSKESSHARAPAQRPQKCQVAS